MKTQTVNTFLFSELSEDAKKYALNKYSEMAISDYWYEDTYHQAKELGITISGFDLDRGQSIDADFIYDEIEVADAIMDFYGYENNIYKIAENFRKERDQLCDNWENDENGEPINVDELDEKLDEMEDEFKKDIFHELWVFLRDEYEYLFSEEYISDHFDNNEYQFTEDGKLFNF